MGRTLAISTFGALSFAAAGPALAQATLGPPTATAPASSSGGGGVTGSAGRSDLSFSLTARYDDNVPRINDLQPNARNLVREDIVISPALTLGVSRRLGRHEIGLSSYLGYNFYTRNTVLDSERISVAPYANLDLPVCDLALRGAVTRGQSDLGELVFLGLDPAFGTRNRQTTKQINARLLCGDAVGLRPTFEIDRNVGDNSNPLRQRANYRTTRIQPGVGYSSPGLGTISIFAFRQDTDLPNQFLLNGQASGYISRGYGLSYARDIGTRLKFNGSISQVDVTPFDTSGGRSGLNGSLALTLLASDRLQLTATADRAFTSTLTGLSTYELSQGYGLSANYAFNDRLRLRVGGRVAPRDFFYAVQPTGPFIGKQTQYDIFGGATYSLNRRLSINFDTGVQRRDTDLDLFDYRSFYASIGMTLPL